MNVNWMVWFWIVVCLQWPQCVLPMKISPEWLAAQWMGHYLYARSYHHQLLLYVYSRVTHKGSLVSIAIVQCSWPHVACSCMDGSPSIGQVLPSPTTVVCVYSRVTHKGSLVSNQCDIHKTKCVSMFLRSGFHGTRLSWALENICDNMPYVVV